MLQTLDALLTRGHAHFLRQLTPTHRTKHLIYLVFHGGSAGKPGLIAVIDLLWLTGAQWLVLTKGACCQDTRAGVDVEVATS